MKTKNCIFGKAAANLAIVLLVALSFSPAAMAGEWNSAEDAEYPEYPLLDIDEYLAQLEEPTSTELIDIRDHLMSNDEALPDYLRFYVINLSEVAEYETQDELYKSPLLNLSFDDKVYTDVPQFCNEAYPTAEYRSGGIKEIKLPYDIEEDTIAVMAVSSIDGSLRYIAQVVDVEDSVSEEENAEFGKNRYRVSITFYDNGIAYKTVMESWETRCVIDIVALENDIPVEFENSSRIAMYWTRFSEFFLEGNRRPFADEKENVMHPVTIVY